MAMMGVDGSSLQADLQPVSVALC